MSTSNGHATHVRDAARRFFDSGFRPIPVRYRLKKPIGDGWNAATRDGFDIDREFPAARSLNIGLLNGAVSSGLVDIDLDCREARTAAPHLLPPTGMMWGRASAPTSHYGYIVADPPKKSEDSFDAPNGGGHLVEIRSTGGHTLVPPSIAPADEEQGKVEEPVVWHRDGEPARVAMADLRQAVVRTASAALIARHWPIGGRHDASLALAGGLLRAGWTVEAVETFLRAVCVAAGDDELDDRLRAVASTAERLSRGETAVGWPTVAKLLGDAVVGKSASGWACG